MRVPITRLFLLAGLFFPAHASATSVVEFYNTTLDNYFITADANEAAQIDSGSAGPGWSRTGNTFYSGGSASVCRFYGSQSPGPNSHFYTVDPGECQGLKDQQILTGDPRKLTVKSWNFESLDFISTPPTTGGVNGTCPTGTTPVYRAYNNGYARGVDSNHRITSSAIAISEVVARGWGNEGVVMCAPGGGATPAATMVGEPADTPTSKTIGASGGTLTSADGRLRLDIPAGALGADQTISIQPVANTAPGGIGHGFALTPNGQTFAQAITLTYTPGSNEWSNTGSSTPGLAFQRADGTWQVIPVTAGAVTGTFTGQTTHFTNFSFYESFSIRGVTPADDKTAVFAGGRTFNLHVVQYSPPVMGSSGFMSLSGTASTYTANNCCEWLVNGQTSASGGSSGDITPLGVVAAYSPPAHLPPTGKNPVAISAHVIAPDGSRLTLVKNIHILAHQYKIALTLKNIRTCLPSDAGFATADTFTSTGNVLLTLDNNFNITGSDFNVLNAPPTVTELSTCDPAKWTVQWLADQTHDTSIIAASGSYSEAQGKLHFMLTGEYSDIAPKRITEIPLPYMQPIIYTVSETRNDFAYLSYYFYFDGFDGEVVDYPYSATGNRNSTDYGFAITVTKE